MPAPTCSFFVFPDRCGLHPSEDNIHLAPCKPEGCADYLAPNTPQEIRGEHCMSNLERTCRGFEVEE